LCMVSQSPYGVNHRLESRMREIRTYGSEGGAAGQPAVPTPIRRGILQLEIEFVSSVRKRIGISSLPRRVPADNLWAPAYSYEGPTCPSIIQLPMG
ncbi:MAG: hypothetical protein ACLQPD_15690, partial [Desulfomonilaceae bacterium]